MPVVIDEFTTDSQVTVTVTGLHAEGEGVIFEHKDIEKLVAHLEKRTAFLILACIACRLEGETDLPDGPDVDRMAEVLRSFEEGFMTSTSAKQHISICLTPSAITMIIGLKLFSRPGHSLPKAGWLT